MKSRMPARLCFTLLLVIVVSLSAGGRAAAAAPPAPSPVSPADGSAVTEPFIISWTAVSDPSGIVAYNWQVSSSSAFTSVLLQFSTSGAMQDTVSGLANGTYFWRVQAVSHRAASSTTSPTRSRAGTNFRSRATPPSPRLVAAAIVGNSTGRQILGTSPSAAAWAGRSQGL